MAATSLVVMGVSGSGKSTVAKLLAGRLGWPFAEGDEFHPEANVAKMRAGVPLTDADREPWLRTLRDWIGEQAAAGKSTVVTCSALRRAYRDLLREADADVRFVHLDGTRELIAERLAHRSGHFMPPALLDSQFAALEPLGPDEAGIVVDVADAPEDIVDAVVARLDD
ncbi:gluconokinase [Glycomyces terrestris]|uniref:Gluconokinase n=1 Tax=Glycomyces terrestris TaxID=2493553 RepID=A0A426V4N0_9ACTN|nr:gluconokinase [Glycomyces terrestris]RRS01780.1 gluconokinase [Glycomyces terrestris]